jgi:hypothetical protein
MFGSVKVLSFRETFCAMHFGSCLHSISECHNLHPQQRTNEICRLKGSGTPPVKESGIFDALGVIPRAFMTLSPRNLADATGPKLGASPSRSTSSDIEQRTVRQLWPPENAGLCHDS